MEFCVSVVEVTTVVEVMVATAAEAAGVELELGGADEAMMLSREVALWPSVIGRVAGGSFSAARDISSWSIRLCVCERERESE